MDRLDDRGVIDAPGLRADAGRQPARLELRARRPEPGQQHLHHERDGDDRAAAAELPPDLVQAGRREGVREGDVNLRSIGYAVGCAYGGGIFCDGGEQGIGKHMPFIDRRLGV